MLKPAGVIDKFLGKKLSRIHGVAVGQHSLCAISGDQHCLYQFDRDTHREIRATGSFGYKYGQFNEPVAISYWRGRFYVADWKNHRVAIYDEELQLLETIGYFGFIPAGPLVGRVITALKQRGGLDKFGEVPESSKRWMMRRLRSIASNLGYELYWLGPWELIRRLAFTDGLRFCKPDGFAFIGDEMFISQHYNHAITRLNLRDGSFSHFCRLGAAHGELKRPSNMEFNSERGELYVSDTKNERIEVFDLNLCYRRTIVGRPSSVLGTFFPFGLKCLSGQVLAVCGMESIQLIDLNTSKAIFHISGDYDELHGLEFDRRRAILYAADKNNGRICLFSVDSAILG